MPTLPQLQAAYVARRRALKLAQDARDQRVQDLRDAEIALDAAKTALDQVQTALNSQAEL